jgi:hypothetical protein
MIYHSSTRGIQFAPAKVRRRAADARPTPVAKSSGHRAKLPPSVPAPSELVLGELTGFDDAGRPLVAYSGSASAGPVAARSTAVLGPSDVGRSVVLAFEGNVPGAPIILGVLQPALPANDSVGPSPIDAEIDGQRITLTAAEEIVLRCGQASITLTRAGKVLIRGAYVLSRSSGVNRLKGGSVQIN